MQNGAAACDAEVDFQVPVMIPRQRDDAVAAIDAQSLQGIGDLAGAPLRSPPQLLRTIGPSTDRDTISVVA